MCGLVGAAGNLFTNDRKAFRNLLVLDVLRGDHSTGIAVIESGGNTKVMKEIGHPYNLFNSFKEAFEGGGVVKAGLSKVLIGHNRYGTMGKIISDNAHPFWHNHIVGAHNGTLDKYWLSNLDDHKKFEVDSEALIYNISIHGPEIINKVSGAYALTWWDQKQEKMFFIRNDKRPLHFTRSKDRDAFFWASEPWMLKYGLGKAGVAHTEIEEFETNHLYSLDVTKSTQEFRKVDLEKGEKIEGFTPPPVTRTTVIGGKHGSNRTEVNTGTGNPFRPQQSMFLPSFHTPPISTPTSWRELAKKLNKYIGKSLSFWSDMERKSPTGQYFLSCSPVHTEDDFEIRLYTKGKDVHEEYRTARAPLVGTVKKVVHNRINGKHEVYVLMDYRTIIVPPDPSQTAKNIIAARNNVVPFVPTGKRGDFRGYLGIPYTEEEWITATQQGCSYCDSAVEPEEASKLHWFGHTDFLCEQCAADPEKRQYAY